jgi:hypothetical protein
VVCGVVVAVTTPVTFDLDPTVVFFQRNALPDPTQTYDTVLTVRRTPSLVHVEPAIEGAPPKADVLAPADRHNATPMTAVENRLARFTVEPWRRGSRQASLCR